MGVSERLVLVDWFDSFGVGPDWSEWDEAREVQPLVCQSVGWVLRDNNDVLVIASHRSDKDHKHSSQQWCGDMTIPKVAVVKVTNLHTC